MSMRNPIMATTAAVALLVMVSASGAFAQQSSDQQKCLNGLNKDGAGVVKTQGKEDTGCLKAAGSGKLVGSAQTCLSADSKGKVQKAKDKTSALETKSCTTPPTFGYTSAATVNNAAVQGDHDLTTDIFGSDLDTAVISCSSNKAGCQCQQKVLGTVDKLVLTKLGTFVKCKQATLKSGANSAAALRACVNDAGTAGSIAADSGGKVAKGAAAITAAITKSCTGVSGAFPGACSAQTGNALGTCLDTHIECRVCQIINEMDGIFVNCDLFDNGVADASCASGTGPTPTPSATPTPTATSTPPQVLVGALTATAGRFNYNLMLGLPGANAACNSNFSGSHVCTYAELQSAEAAGNLVGLKDTSDNTVTSFWAIDPTADPLLQPVPRRRPRPPCLLVKIGNTGPRTRGRAVRG